MRPNSPEQSISSTRHNQIGNPFHGLFVAPVQMA
jgi:hypothetical protein